MINWTLLELYYEALAAEARGRRSAPVPPPRPAWRQRLAQGLVALGLRLDADASRAAIGSFDVTPRLNGSDA